MTPMACAWCGEIGSIPDQLIGKKIRCQKCGTSFVAEALTSPIAPVSGGASKSASADGTLSVDGLDPSAWAATAVAVDTRVQDPEPREPAPSVTASPQAVDQAAGPIRQYKVLTQKDRWFEGKFELARLEEALNHYARQGWVVRAMATPHVVGFSGGPREELVVLLER